MAKYNLTITENQGQVLCKALELLSRIYMGQLGDIAFQVFAGMQDTDRYCKLRDGLEALETLATGLERNAFHGIYSDKISDVARIAWDLQQVIRYRISHDRADREGVPKDFASRMTVNYDPPMRSSKTEELAAIEEKNELPKVPRVNESSSVKSKQKRKN